jgi:glycosyltransferase involved in cell wall biosynthesis
MSVHVMHVTTVPQTLIFFRGQVGYLKQNGFDVTVVSSPGPWLDRFAALEHVPAVAVPISRRVTPLADLASLWRLVRVVLRHKPDIVHSHTPKAALLGTVAARLARRRAVLSIFGLPQMTLGGAARAILNGKTRFECALAHRVWCDSFSMREFLIAHKLCRSDKIVVLGHGSVCGVDAEGVFNPARFSADERRARKRTWHIPPDAVVIGFVGRIVRDKGIHELGAAWRALRVRYPNLHLLLVGDAEPTDPIDAQTDSMLRRDERVHRTGHQDDVAPLYAMMDLFVMPSYREGFGVSNVEAAALSVPVVATRIPGCVDSVADGTTGTLVPPRNAEALTEAIVRYLDDPGLRRLHGEAGRRRVLAEFVPPRIWSELAGLYRSVLHPAQVPDADRSARRRRRGAAG